MVQKLGKLVGLDVHQAHMAALWLNFAIIAAVIVWAGYTRAACAPTGNALFVMLLRLGNWGRVMGRATKDRAVSLGMARRAKN